VSGVRAAVLGAGGTIAPAIVRDLAESAEVGDLLLIDLAEERAQAVADEHGLGKARAVPGDARAGLAVRLRDVDVLVNAASYRVNCEAMRACLAAGCHYLDLGGLYWMIGRQLELDAEFRGAGLLALLGMGSSPGKTNLMALRAVRELGEAPERVSVVAAGRDLDPPEGLSLPYSLETLLDELKLPPVAIADGRPRELAPLSSGGSVRLPEPVGEAETIYTLHSELRTFPDTLGCREASFRLSLEPGLLRRLRELAAAPYREVADTAWKAARPSPRTVAFHVVEAEARDGRAVRITARTDPAEAWGLGGGVVSTGAPAAAAVRLLARGRVQARGALPPESCVEPGELLPELEQRGCRFTVERREAVAT